MIQRWLWCVGVVAACGDGASGPPDAARTIDAAPLVPACQSADAVLACDFSCITTPWPTTAPDPLVFSGLTSDPVMGVVPGALVEVRGVTDDALLGQVTSRTSAGPGQEVGAYSISVVSGSAAPTVYRKVTATNHADSYTYDPTPTFSSIRQDTAIISVENVADVYQVAGRAADPTQGTVEVIVRDCARNTVVNATVEVPGAARVLYESMTQTVSRETTATGVHGWAFAVGVPAGPIDITVRAGTTTYRPWPIKVVANAFTASLRMP